MPRTKSTTPCVCQKCGRDFLAPTKEVKRGRGKFCSRACYETREPAAQRPEVTCEVCGETFQVKPYKRDTARFCSYTCMGVANGQRFTVPIADRFWSKVNKHGPVPEFRPDLGPCWIWLAAYYPSGYGLFNRSHGRPTNAHIVAYDLTIGPVPDGLELDHLCRVRACVNPAHLEPVTDAENKRRGLGGRLRTHCPQGHHYDAENTAIERNGARRCRECARLRCSPHNVRQRSVVLKPRKV